VLKGRRAVVVAGFVLVALGIGALFWSHALAQGWWQDTLQALGVGLVIGGLVDVLALAGLDRIVSTDDQRRKRLNDRARLVFQADYKDDEARNAAIDAFVSESQGQLSDLEPGIASHMTILESLARLIEKDRARSRPAQQA
jgi:hypothetical protein